MTNSLYANLPGMPRNAEPVKIKKSPKKTIKKKSGKKARRK